MKIVFMGTPEFAVKSLNMLIEHDYEVKAVVTAPDKPAGRGKKLRMPEVKKFALEKGLRILQPEKLRSEQFIQTLREIKPDVIAVVAFRMLPKVVWEIPQYGTFNLHASLLPHYRGAAPINWAIINGESVTGVTTFLINEAIDTGNIILQEKVNIAPDETAGNLHDKLMVKGAELVMQTIDTIKNGNLKTIDQNDLLEKGERIKTAPKIHRDDCKIDWHRDLTGIYNFIRGLSPCPAAWTLLSDGEKSIPVKLFLVEKIQEAHSHQVPEIITDNRSYLKIAVRNGFVNVLELQMAGKKRMPAGAFLRGFQSLGQYQIH